MTSRKITIEKVTVHSARPFEDVLRALEKGIGRPNMSSLREQMDKASSFPEFQTIIHGAVGDADLMEFLRLDLGGALRKDPAARAYRIVRIIAGNPLIMKQMVEHVPEAGSYAPVTILVYEREDGVHVSYDLMGSYLADCGSEKALQVAKDLDAKVV